MADSYERTWFIIQSCIRDLFYLCISLAAVIIFLYHGNITEIQGEPDRKSKL